MEEYRGILDECAQEQARARDRSAERWDNEERGRSTPGEARLERLRREAAVCTTHHAACACGQLAELRLMELCQRLERENAALREVAELVIWTFGTFTWDVCPACGAESRMRYVVSGVTEPILHETDCPFGRIVEQARAALEAEGGA